MSKMSSPSGGANASCAASSSIVSSVSAPGVDVLDEDVVVEDVDDVLELN